MNNTPGKSAMNFQVYYLLRKKKKREREREKMDYWERIMLQTFPGDRVLTEKEVLNCGLFGDTLVSQCTTSPKSVLCICLMLLEMRKTFRNLRDETYI